MITEHGEGIHPRRKHPILVLRRSHPRPWAQQRTLTSASPERFRGPL